MYRIRTLQWGAGAFCPAASACNYLRMAFRWSREQWTSAEFPRLYTTWTQALRWRRGSPVGFQARPYTELKSSGPDEKWSCDVVCDVDTSFGFVGTHASVVHLRVVPHSLVWNFCFVLWSSKCYFCTIITSNFRVELPDVSVKQGHQWSYWVAHRDV